MIISVSTLHHSSDIRIVQRILRLLSENYTRQHLIIARDSPSICSQNVKTIAIAVHSNPLYRLCAIASILYKNRRLVKGSCLILNDPEILILRPFVASLRPKILIYDSHEDPVSSTINSLEFSAKEFLRIIAKIIYFPFLVVFTANIIVISPTKLILSRFVLASKKFLIPNFPTQQELDISNREVKILPPPALNTPIQLINVGNLSKNRASKEILEVLRYLPHKYKLVIAGKIDSYTEKCISLLDQELRERISVVGNLQLDQLYLILNTCHLGLCLYRPIPSYSNSLPLKIIDYALTRTPIVCSNFAYWNTIYQTFSHCNCVDDLDPQKIAEKIVQVIADYNSSMNRAYRFNQYFNKALVLDQFVSKLSIHLND